jgi:hypothetical protein
VQLPDSEWLFLAFVVLVVLVVLWLPICAFISILSGWRELAERFKSDAPLEGERFRFRSGAMGARFFPVNYGSCLFATVGPKGFALSILVLFRFLHPRLVVSWSAVERCEPVKYWFMNYIAVHIIGFSRRILLNGSLGRKVLETWSQARESS